MINSFLERKRNVSYPTFELDFSNPNCYSGTGNTVTDLANGLVCNVYPGVSFSPSDKSFYFTGASNSFIRAPHRIVDSSYQELSVIIFVQPVSKDQSMMVENGTASNLDSFYMYIWGSSRSLINNINTNGASYFDSYYDSVIQTKIGLWQSFGLTYKPGMLRSFQDGIMRKNRIVGGAATSIYNGNAPLTLGGRASNTSATGVTLTYIGKIGYIYLVNRAITDEEMLDLHNLHKSKFGL